MISINASELPQKNAPWFVGILVFDNVEVLDFCGPFEVLSITRFLDEEKQRTDYSPFIVRLISEFGGIIRSSNGLKVFTDLDFNNHPEIDLVLVPGGWGTRKEVQNSVLIDWLRVQKEKAQLMASVCTGSFLLAQAGLLDGLEATTHWKSIEKMKIAYPKVQVIQGRRFIVSGQGKIITSAGIAAGIDMSLFLVSELLGYDIGSSTAHHMEYPWKYE